MELHEEYKVSSMLDVCHILLKMFFLLWVFSFESRSYENVKGFRFVYPNWQLKEKSDFPGSCTVGAKV